MEINDLREAVAKREKAKETKAAGREEQIRQEVADREELLRREAARKEALLQEERKKVEQGAELWQQAGDKAGLQTDQGSTGTKISKKWFYIGGGCLVVAALVGLFLFFSSDKKADPSSAAGGALQQEKKAADTAVVARRVEEEFYLPLLRLHARHNREHRAWLENDYNRVQWENKQHSEANYKATATIKLAASKDRFAASTDQGGYIQEVAAKRKGLQIFVTDLKKEYSYSGRLETVWRTLFEVLDVEESYYHRVAAGETRPEFLWDSTALALAKFDYALQECTSGAEAFGQLTPAKYGQLRLGMDYLTITRLLQVEGYESNVVLRNPREEACSMVYQSPGRKVYVQFVNYQAINISKVGF